MAKSSKNKSQSGKNLKTNRDELIFRYDDLSELCELLKTHQMAEIEWEGFGQRLILRSEKAFYAGAAHMHGHHMAPAPLPAAPMTNAVAATNTENTASKKTEVSGKQKTIKSPFVGTFYRSASPESDPYVKEGQTVKAGEVLCIIEAMKLMNEIESDTSGRVVSILVENGQPVEFGEPLFIVEPN